MFSQNSKPNRRAFLERSMLGFGSAFLLPSLLTSCTDHLILDPGIGTPTLNPPLLGDSSIDWNDAAKEAVATGITMALPEGGEILSLLVGVFWPDNKPSPWDQVKDEVETLVNQKIGDFEYQQVTEDLNGLQNLITVYLEELSDGSSIEKLIQWINISDAFAQALPHFQATQYQVPLLGLFGQFANMYLSVLRDVVVHGSEWGRTPADQVYDSARLKKFINDFTTYTSNTYSTYRDNLTNQTPTDIKGLQPFLTVNAYNRQMTSLVLDFMDAWQYYDVTQYPQGKQGILFTREIYTDPVGSGLDTPLKVPSPGATDFPVEYEVWSNDHYFSSIQITYPVNPNTGQGTGPGGVVKTPRWGGDGDTRGVYRDYPISTGKPVIEATVSYDDYVHTLQFTYDGGQKSDILGVNQGNITMGFGYLYQAISSVYVQSNAYVSKPDRVAANCIVFGFRYWKSPGSTTEAAAKLYVTSPKERSAADFAKAFPKLGLVANSITPALKEARKVYWATLKARAEKIKNKPK